MNLDHVAKKAGVSSATVSRVINGVDLVKPSTRVRVLRAMTDLKYYPNLHARSLAGGVSRTIGMIVSNLDNPFFWIFIGPWRPIAMLTGMKFYSQTHRTRRSNWLPASG